MSPMSETHYSNGDHILLLPFLAQGHLIPFTALARLLEQRTPYTITIINTSLNIQRLRSSLPENTTIRLVSLPFNSSDHGLPPNCENTNTVPPHLILRFVQATESLQPAFDNLISAMCIKGSRPLCVISDFVMSWSIQSAERFGIFSSIFNTGGAYGSVIYTSLWTHLPLDQSNSDEFSLLDFTDVKLRRSQLPHNIIDADEINPWALFVKKLFAFAGRSNGFLLNTVDELEGKALQQFKKNVQSKVWAIGPLALLSPPPVSSSMLTCVQWLNQHPSNSVLYISFGSENSINPSPMMELAKGLEACGKPFIWVIRPPNGFDVNDEFRTEWLPEGFEDRITDRKQGILVKKWAPQLEILSHKSTAAFLSHCGWNSILESLSQGVPIIGWPMGAEQPYNLKLLEEELGVGVEMARGSDAEIRWVDFVKVFGWVMDGESKKGMEMRRNAKQIEQLMKAATGMEGRMKGSSVIALEDFTQMALSDNPRRFLSSFEYEKDVM